MRVEFRDLWPDFNIHCNYYTQLLRIKYDVEVVDKDPDVLFFSGLRLGKTNRDSYLPGVAKISINGESQQFQPIQDDSAHLHLGHMIGDNRVLLPHWLLYIDWFENTPADYYTCSGSLSPKELIFNREHPEKTKFCAYIARHGGFDPKRYRTKFTQQLMQYKHVDCPGNDLKNTSFPADHITAEHGRPGSKMEYLKDYKFNVAFENRVIEHYTTEKLIQPLITGTIPIYWGDRSSLEVFNEKAFIYAEDFNTAIEQVKKIDNDHIIYTDMTAESILKDNKLPEYLTNEYLLSQIESVL